jgi:hypothetical protein
VPPGGFRPAAIWAAISGSLAIEETPMTYAQMKTLPAWEPARWEDGKALDATPGTMRWSNPEPPPAIGEEIIIKMNNCGPAIVTGYFVEHGWLGVRCTLLDPPEWHRKQNNGDATGGHIFGAEFRRADQAA